MSTVQLKSSKYLILAEQLRAQIEQGVLKPGDRLPSFAEMRAEHNVTITTIERAYSHLEKDNLIVCERGRGTFVASPLEKKLTGLIGVSDLGHIQHPYNTEFMRGLKRGASQCDLEVLLMDASSDRRWERVDGVIAHGYDAPQLVNRLPQGMPSVVVMHASVPNAICVVADERTGISTLVEHLLGRGHRRIAAMMDSLSRLAAYRDALHTAGIEADPHWSRYNQVDDAQEASYAAIGYRTMKQWLAEDWDDLGCTAILTQNDDNAHGVMEALRQAGKRVPEDISVTGFDGTELGSYFKPSLTTVEVPLVEIGASAVELLYRQIQGENIRPITLMLPVSLKVGDSTGPKCRSTIKTTE